jgi:hypothetical protein
METTIGYIFNEKAYEANSSIEKNIRKKGSPCAKYVKVDNKAELKDGKFFVGEKKSFFAKGNKIEFYTPIEWFDCYFDAYKRADEIFANSPIGLARKKERQEFLAKEKANNDIRDAKALEFHLANKEIYESKYNKVLALANSLPILTEEFTYTEAGVERSTDKLGFDEWESSLYLVKEKKHLSLVNLPRKSTYRITEYDIEDLDYFLNKGLTHKVKDNVFCKL